MSSSLIQIKGAREHNLKNISLDIPRNKLVVITGHSGSGKSSLAFDTIYAEGQRRYLESLSSYARQFLEKLKKPEVDYISGLSPTIAIEQRAITHNPRSTVATVTELYDYLRLLFAKAGTPHCHECGSKLTSQTLESILSDVLKQFKNQDIQILAPVVRGRKGEFQKVFQSVLKQGFSKARIDGKIKTLDPELKLRKTHRHDIEIVIDYLSVKSQRKAQLLQSLRMASELGEGSIAVMKPTTGKKVAKLHFYSTKRTCAKCHTSYPELTPNMFSFNSPYGACSKCKGLGKLSQVLHKGVIVDPKKPLMSGGVNKDIFFSFNKYFIQDLLHELTEKYHFDWHHPFEDWPEKAQEAFFWGDDELSGLIDELERLFHETSSEQIKRKVKKFLKEDVCPGCKGKRLKKESLGVLIGGASIVEMTSQSVEDAAKFFKKMKIENNNVAITEPILKEIRERIVFLNNVGLGYLTLDRTVATLAGGELQRIRLAAQIGVGLTGVLYILDEPSIGLHPRDNEKLLNTLEKLRDMKNTVIVVEHDEETMRRADHLIDLGPGAGIHGGDLVAEGNITRFKKGNKRSATAQYLSGDLEIMVPTQRKKIDPKLQIELKGCKEHNLKNVNLSLPLGLFICVTGVSGSGKSTLIHDTLYRLAHNHVWRTDHTVGKFRSIKGLKLIDKVIEVDQSPIGRTPRSNPATYTDIFGFIRKLFAEQRESKIRNYSASRFSFNLKGGRCEHCRGEGQEKLQMSFMPDLFVLCEHCRGKKYNPETLEIKYREKNISEVLNLSVSEAVDFFSHISTIQEKLLLLKQIGLGYIKLGQSSTTLSGGEAQRVKLASELNKKASGKTLYLLDEPTTGLHFADVENLLGAILQLRDQGNTVVVIEHNLDVIKTADHIIDLGPEGGSGGGQIIASGTPEMVAKVSKSYTGKFLREIL